MTMHLKWCLLLLLFLLHELLRSIAFLLLLAILLMIPLDHEIWQYVIGKIHDLQNQYCTLDILSSLKSLQFYVFFRLLSLSTFARTRQENVISVRVHLWVNWFQFTRVLLHPQLIWLFQKHVCTLRRLPQPSLRLFFKKTVDTRLLVTRV